MSLVTMSDIAQRAGVARSTVSFILNGERGDKVRVSEETRQRVRQAAEELGYRTNALVRAMQTGKTRMIGFIISDISYEPMWTMISGAVEEADAAGYTIKLLPTTKGNLENQVKRAIEMRVDGLICRYYYDEDKPVIYREAANAQTPLVMLEESSCEGEAVCIMPDDRLAMRHTINHLLQLGHRRIAYLTGIEYSTDVQVDSVKTLRQKYFLEEMKRVGLDVPEGYIESAALAELEAQQDKEQWFAPVNRLLDHPQGAPTAICCWRDETAMLAIQACHARQLHVPNDISITGFSNLRTAMLYSPSLTTAVSPWEEMGRLAVRSILSREDVTFAENNPIYIPTSFVARHSTGKAPD